MTSTTRYLTYSTGLSCLVTVIAALWSLVLLPDVPDDVPTRLNQPDSATMSAFTLWLILTLSSALIIVVFTALAIRGGMWHGVTARFIAALTTATVTFLAVTQISVFRIFAAHDTETTMALITGVIAAIVMGMISSLGARPVPTNQRAVSQPDAAELRRGGSIAWTGVTALPDAVRVTGWLVIMAFIIGALFVPVSLRTGLLVAAAIFSIALLTATSWRLRAGADGFSWQTTPLTVISRRIPLHEIASVRLTDVRPGYWGGWGMRKRPGTGTALVTHSGAGIEITRESGDIFVVSVDTADQAIAVLRAQGIALTANVRSTAN